MNVLDSHFLEGCFAARGYLLVPEAADADVIVLNTCSVREHVENKLFSRLGSLKALKRQRPDMTVVVAGCIAERLGEKLIDRFEVVDLVVGTRRVGELLDLVEAARATTGGAFIGEGDVVAARRDAAYRSGGARSFVCAMRGCDNFCAYCVVPYVRGRQTSRPAEEIVDEVKRLVDDGVKVVTLLGQNVAAYGKDAPDKHTLSMLLGQLQEVDGLEWIKFITCHPRDTGQDVFDAMRDLPKVCRYIHMPAQSGADVVLRRMKRGYTREKYLDKIARLRETVREVSIAGDFIVGFPGESISDFDKTVSFLREVGYKNSFVFKYSPRPGTAATRMADNVSAKEKARRNNVLLDVQRAVSLAHNQAFVGRRVRVFAEGPSKKNPAELAGRTEGDEVVIFKGEGIGECFVTVEITGASGVALFGKLVE